MNKKLFTQIKNEWRSNLWLVTDADDPCAEPLPGYKKVNPMVYCGLYVCADLNL